MQHHKRHSNGADLQRNVSVTPTVTGERPSISGVHVAHSVIDTILTHARSAAPHEACGLLFGHVSGWDLFIDAAIETQNVTTGDPATSFEISPQVQFKWQRTMRSRSANLKPIGHFHSHPGQSPIPSSVDRSAVTDRTALWLIAGGKLEQFADIQGFFPTAQGFQPVVLLTH